MRKPGTSEGTWLVAVVWDYGGAMVDQQINSGSSDLLQTWCVARTR